jgi:hypothetical protein
MYYFKHKILARNENSTNKTDLRWVQQRVNILVSKLSILLSLETKKEYSEQKCKNCDDERINLRIQPKA